MALNIEELDKKIHQKQMELVELEEFRSLFLKYGDDISGKNGITGGLPRKNSQPGARLVPSLPRMQTD